ncbi:unnamed protein product [Diamesa serratosioi]
MSSIKDITTPVDDDLDELLDSALDDFDKVNNKSPANSTEIDDPPMESLWNDEFIASQSKVFEAKMAELFGAAGTGEISAEQMQLGFARLAEAASLAVDPNSSTDNTPQVDSQFTQSITDVLKGLSEGQENLQQPFSSDDIAGMFGNINLNETGENNAFLPFMQGMMQSLLSAEVLLPSLKDLVTKYPSWLAENGSTISTEDKERYENQLKLMKEVCDELESEKPEDSPEVKKDRFNIVLDRMQKMQELGQPPTDLVGETDNAIPNLELGAGMPGMPGMPGAEQCSIM